MCKVITNLLSILIIPHSIAIVYSVKFAFESDPYINPNLLVYSRSHQALPSYNSGYSNNNAASNQIGASPSYTGKYEELCHQASNRLNRELENLYAEVDRIAVAERLEYEEKLREENHVEIPRVAIYGLGAILILTGITLNGGSQFPLNAIGFGIQEFFGYFYEEVIAIELPTDDCTTGQTILQPQDREYRNIFGIVNSRVAYESDTSSFGGMSDDGIIPAQYWIQNNARLENLRTKYGCLSESGPLEKQFELIEKAGKLRTKLLQQKKKIHY